MTTAPAGCSARRTAAGELATFAAAKISDGSAHECLSLAYGLCQPAVMPPTAVSCASQAAIICCTSADDDRNIDQRWLTEVS